MSTLAALSLKKAYHKPEDNIAADFYLPAVAAATRYDRAVGFFSSSIYILAWPSLRQFVANDGKMRLICSPILSEEDQDAIRDGYSDRAEAICAERITHEFSNLLASPKLAKPATVLASLVALGTIECKIAWIGGTAGGRPRRLFHDKVGLLADSDGNQVVFKGSMNETWPALSPDGNLESVDVFVSGGGERERERIEDERAYFDRLWANDWPGVTIRPLPESARAEITSTSDAANWPEFVDDICLDLERAATWSAEADRSGGRVPRPHQVAALDEWKARGRRGILEHATGSGKTFTALCAIHDGFRLNEIPLILVPSDLLFQQWEEELRNTFDPLGLQLLLCGSGNDGWRESARLRGWTRHSDRGHPPRAVLSTIQTAAGSDFLGLCANGSHLFMVADEVHRLGAEKSRQIFNIVTGPRLGLSATPRRAGDPVGTEAILDYFERIVDPPFGIHDAVAAGALTPYAYHVHPIRLDENEQSAWNKLTDEYRRLYARAQAGGVEQDSGTNDRLKRLLIQRARIVKGASKKTDLAASVLARYYEPGQRWIVYCDDRVQLGRVKQALIGAGHPDIYEYHSAMPGDRASTLEIFGARGGTIVSIRCLDEGVDIPSVSHALILASSRNPREFIQRRGRVLRRSPNKMLAHIHDVIVAPHDGQETEGESILVGELARAIEFGSHAINPASVTDLRRLAAEIGIDWDAAAGGYEDDEEDDVAVVTRGEESHV